MVKNYQSGKLLLANAGRDYSYKYFMPNNLPRKYQWSDTSITLLLEEATHHLGELNAYAKLVPDISFFIKMHEAKEATQSSFIEGTKTEVDEAVMQEEDIDPERRDDWKEVQNYISAMKFAIKSLEDIPLSMRIIKDAHTIMLANVRGQHKAPGTVRTSQNWIGGATIKDARFIPPIADEVPQLLGDLEKYWHDTPQSPHIIKAGLSHYQFETIHPFLDGNGRMGRLLIVLYLIDKKMIDKPILYLSDFFAKHRNEYYDALDVVRFSGNLDLWVKFFLVAISETAKKSCKTLQDIIDLRQSDESNILILGKRSKNAAILIKEMYSRPIISINNAAIILNISHQSANSLVSELVKMGILKEFTGFSRNRMYVYENYVKLFR